MLYYLLFYFGSRTLFVFSELYSLFSMIYFLSHLRLVVPALDCSHLGSPALLYKRVLVCVRLSDVSLPRSVSVSDLGCCYPTRTHFVHFSSIHEPPRLCLHSGVAFTISLQRDRLCHSGNSPEQLLTLLYCVLGYPPIVFTCWCSVFW